jgi:hypothetical protein
MSEQIPPVLSYADLKDNYVKLTWNTSGTSYVIYKDGAVLGTTGFTWFGVGSLTGDQDYTFHVQATDKYGRTMDSAPITVHTPLSPPGKPNLKTSDITKDSFKLEWGSDPPAQSYSVYFGGKLVKDHTSDTSHVFEGLKPSTPYEFKVIAHGVVDVEALASVTTKGPEVPTITHAAVAPVPDQLQKRNLTYKANDLVEQVKVYLNDKLIGTYPVSNDAIELDFTDLPPDDLMAKLKVEPIPEGKPYELKTYRDASKDNQMNDFLSLLMGLYDLIRNAFWYIALGSLPLVLAVLIFFWTRKKYKKTFDIGRVPQEMPKVGEYNKPPKDDPIREKYQRKTYRKPPVKGSPDEGKSAGSASGAGGRQRQPFTEKEKLAWRSRQHEARTGFAIKDIKVVRQSVGFMGSGGIKVKEHITYERNGVDYVKRHVKGQGQVYQPKTFKDKTKHVSNQFKAVKTAFTGSNKKLN